MKYKKFLDIVYENTNLLNQINVSHLSTFAALLSGK